MRERQLDRVAGGRERLQDPLAVVGTHENVEILSVPG
jgi:hypothetical protein